MGKIRRIMGRLGAARKRVAEATGSVPEQASTGWDEANGPWLDGMGSLIGPSGVGFRVWAPHASTVGVKGTFNDWQPAPLHDFDGYWYGYVEGAKVGDEYQYEITNGEFKADRNDPYALQVTNSVGNTIVYDHDAFDWSGDDFNTPPFNDMVIYEAHVGSFNEKGNQDGDFASVADKLGHLQKLGVNVLQLMPVAEFAGDRSWGYNPAHIFAVESAYGGPDALKKLVKRAHSMGIAVIMDVVYNHFGPSDLDLWQFDGWSENDKGGIYFYNDERSNTPWGDTRPDYGRGEVRQFIFDNAQMWLRDYHVDGLRYDMTAYIRSVDASGWDLDSGWSMLQWMNGELRDQFPGKILIAEDLHSHDRVTSTADDGLKFHSQWDARFVHPVRAAIVNPTDEGRSMDALRDAITASYGETFERVIYTESHDEVANGKARVPEEIHPGAADSWAAQKRSTAGAGLVLTAPGIPMLFQGQEFLEDGWFRDDVPLDWDRNQDFRGLVRLYRDLIQLRRDFHATTKGLKGHGLNVFHVNDAMNMIAFQRWHDHGPGDDVVVVLNLSTEPRESYEIGMPTGGLWKLRLNTDAGTYSKEFGDYPSFDVEATEPGMDGFGAHATINIAPYTMLIYSQDN